MISNNAVVEVVTPFIFVERLISPFERWRGNARFFLEFSVTMIGFKLIMYNMRLNLGQAHKDTTETEPSRGRVDGKCVL